MNRLDRIAGISIGVAVAFVTVASYTVSRLPSECVDDKMSFALSTLLGKELVGKTGIESRDNALSGKVF